MEPQYGNGLAGIVNNAIREGGAGQHQRKIATWNLPRSWKNGQSGSSPNMICPTAPDGWARERVLRDHVHVAEMSLERLR